jgi:hypothetical protein
VANPSPWAAPVTKALFIADLLHGSCGHPGGLRAALAH